MSRLQAKLEEVPTVQQVTTCMLAQRAQAWQWPDVSVTPASGLPAQLESCCPGADKL